MTLLEYWYMALKAEVGIKIATSDRILLRQQLYRARAEAGQPSELGTIVIQLPAEPENELWMVRRYGESSLRAFDEGDPEFIQ